MILIQIFGIFIAILLLYYTYLSYRKHVLGLREFLPWAILWVGLILVTIFPSIVNVFLEGLGISRALDLFEIVAIFILLVVIFHNYITVHRLENRIEKFVRAEALEKVGNDETQ
jgi:hypothetical protein